MKRLDGKRTENIVKKSIVESGHYVFDMNSVNSSAIYNQNVRKVKGYFKKTGCDILAVINKVPVLIECKETSRDFIDFKYCRFIPEQSDYMHNFIRTSDGCPGYLVVNFNDDMFYFLHLSTVYQMAEKKLKHHKDEIAINADHVFRYGFKGKGLKILHGIESIANSSYLSI